MQTMDAKNGSVNFRVAPRTKSKLSNLNRRKGDGQSHGDVCLCTQDFLVGVLVEKIDNFCCAVGRHGKQDK
jgi:hypothetical protein